MNKQCGVAKDLMPLCVDGVASEESRAYVAEHTEECQACRECYEGMKKTLEAPDTQAQETELAEFAQAASKLRRRHRIRARRNIIIGAVLAFVLSVAVLIGWNALIIQENHEIHTDDYNLVLSQLSDGRVVVTIDFMDSRRDVTLRMSTNPNPMTDDQYDVNVWLTSSIIPKIQSWTNQTGELGVIEDISRYSKISVGSKVKKGIWQQGDPIAPASAEMEEYYRVEQELDTLRAEYQAMRVGRENIFEVSETLFDDGRMNRLEQRLGALREIVPEWQ